MPVRCLFPLVLLLVLLPSSGLALSSSATPQNVLLARSRTEPVVAIDPRHPSIVVAAANTDYSAPVAGTLPTGYFFSHDGGRSFGQGNAPMHWPYTTGADPTIAISRDGTVFFSYLGETPAYCSGGRSAVLLAHSIDHGRSFRPTVVVDSDPADDKPDMAVETISGHPSHLFFSWTRWHESNGSSDIWISRSLDGGATFRPPLMLFHSSLDNFGSVPVVGPHHRVYVFWAVFPEEASSAVSRTRIMMRMSADDGAHFQAARQVGSSFGSVPRMVQPGSLRNLTMPAVTLGRDGTLYVAWAAVRHALGGGAVESDIQIARSTDGGTSWTRPARVNDSRRGDRFMPAMTAWPNGELGLAFYDRRNGSGSLDVYAARVGYRGRFQISRNVRVNRGPSPVSDIYYLRPGSTCFSPGRFFGDYIGVAPAPHHALAVAWADTQLQIANETDLWFARVPLPAAQTVHASARSRPRARALAHALQTGHWMQRWLQWPAT